MLEKITNPEHVRTFPGHVPMEYVYTAGVAGEAFLRAIKERGQLVACTCPGCKTSYLPPRLFCERCFEKTVDYVDVPARGRVASFTVAHLDLDGNRLEEPVIYVFVNIDGTGGGVIHRLGEVDAEAVEFGMAVEAVFLPPEQRKGSILDIVLFKPVQ